MPEHPKATVSDPREHCFNPLRSIDKKTACQLADVLCTASPQGENTLTVRNGKRALGPGLFAARRFDDISVRSEIKGVAEEVEAMIADLLFSDVLRRVLSRTMTTPSPERTGRSSPASTAPSWGSLTRSCSVSCLWPITNGN